MYTREQLSQYAYFKNNLENKRISDILDPLTGLVSRPYIINFAKSLIEDGTPYTFELLDLDNFKYINDTYGHSAGDGILSAVSEELRNYLSDYGVAGRFGGDEIMIVNLRDRTYSEKKEFCRKMFTTQTVVRRSFKLEDCELFVTATAGLATYPDDADNYSELFTMIDKTLYRGKSKGRNCYIIYVDEKHRDIEIKKLKKNGLYTVFRNMADCFDSSPDINGKLKAIYKGIKDDLHITGMYYITEGGEFKRVTDDISLGRVSDVNRIVTDQIYSTNDLSEIGEKCPKLYSVLKEQEFETVLIGRLGMGPMTFGYIMFAEPHNLRIWQEEELAILFSMARMLSGFIIASGRHFA